jgi:DtxR family transcriptional regulator, Mn-dependent transcriptional regulator
MPDKQSPSPKADDLSPKMRAYLAEVYRLADMQPNSNYVSTSTLADLLAVSAPAVNRMVNRMKDLDLIEHEPYQGIRLTAGGQAEALKQLRSQRITEAFLVHFMQWDWGNVYEEASRISSTASDIFVQRMAELIGQPRYSPHGEPIPSAEGDIEHLDDMLLSDVDDAQEVIVTRMRTREADRLNYIKALGLLPGAHFEVLHKAPFNGPMQLKLDDEYRIIGHNLAELIRVKPVNDLADDSDTEGT